MSESTSDVWGRFEHMLAQHAPELLASLRPPATAEQIEHAQASMGLQLPQDVREAYLRHNGTDKALFPPFCYWASLTEMAEQLVWAREYDEEMRLEYPDQYGPPCDFWGTQKVKAVAGNDLWIPLGLSNTSTTVCIDLDPAPQGAIGQLIVDHGMCGPMSWRADLTLFWSSSWIDLIAES